jgi:hypothetical protein
VAPEMQYPFEIWLSFRNHTRYAYIQMLYYFL